MKANYAVIVLLCICLVKTGYAQTKSDKFNPDTLVVGSDAPPVPMSKWIKGAPITKLEKGKVYLVEFTMIHCPHCKPAIPVLSRISKKYNKDVSVISVYMNDAPGFVKQYIQKLGNQAGFAVAMDDSSENAMEKITWRTWMAKAGNGGYPTLYIIGRDGKLAWIGHPCAWYVDDLVDQIVKTGSYDEVKLKKSQEAGGNTYNLFKDALTDQSKYLPALQALDSFLLRNPENGDWKLRKLELLIRNDELKAYQYAKSVQDNFCKQKDCDPWFTLSNMAYTFIENADRLKHPDWDLVRSLAASQHEISDKMYASGCLAAQAEALYYKGDFKSAVQMQEKAIGQLKYMLSTSQAVKRYYEEKLLLYKQKVASR